MENNTQQKQVYTYKVAGMEYLVTLRFDRYLNGRLVIDLVDQEGEDFIGVTVNLPNADIPDGYVAVKNYSENEGMAEWLVENKIIDEPEWYEPTGWVSVPVCKLLVEPNV